jgi:hypothetical protein
MLLCLIIATVMEDWRNSTDVGGGGWTFKVELVAWRTIACAKAGTRQRMW